MAPKLKVVYFDIEGRAEPLRVTLSVGGIPFEDVRLTNEQFLDNKECKGAFYELFLSLTALFLE